VSLARSTPDPRAGTAPVRSGSLSRNEIGCPAGSLNSRQDLSILPPNSLTFKNIELFSRFFFPRYRLPARRRLGLFVGPSKKLGG